MFLCSSVASARPSTAEENADPCQSLRCSDRTRSGYKVGLSHDRQRARPVLRRPIGPNTRERGAVDARDGARVHCVQLLVVSLHEHLMSLGWIILSQTL